MSEDSIILLLLILHVLAPLFLLYSTIGLYVTKIKLLSCDGSQIIENEVKLKKYRRMFVISLLICLSLLVLFKITQAYTP